MSLHIGELVKLRLGETGMSKSEFARRINRTSQNVYDIFDRASMDTALLLAICEILNYDFFQHYSLVYSQNQTGDNATQQEINKLLKKS